MNENTAVKLELLKLTVELTKFAIEKGAYSISANPKNLEVAFAACHKLISDKCCQANDCQTETTPSNGA